MITIVFSKDRALQLDAFLRSYKKHVTPLVTVDVLYLATSERHQAAYDQVFQRSPWACGWKQLANFQRNVLSMLPFTGYVTFFVDDQVFVHPWRMLELPGLSLRLGLNLTHCYPMNCAQAVPVLQDEGSVGGVSGLLSWKWRTGTLDWRYPLSLDGHVFNLEEIREQMMALDFFSPNTLETALQQYAERYLDRRGFCYRESKIVNIPWTRVQIDYDNRYGQLSSEDFLSYWEQGFQIDLGHLTDIHSAHQEFTLTLEAQRVLALESR